MIIFAYGEDYVSALNHIKSLKVEENCGQVLWFDFSKPDYEKKFFEQITPTLFSDRKILIIENLLRVGQVKLLEKIPEDVLVFIWHRKRNKPSILNKFPKNTRVINFKEGTTLFNFLDFLVPDPKILQEYKNLKQENPDPNLFFFFLLKQIRLLLLLKGARNLEEVKEYDSVLSWKKEKLLRQKEKFSLESLKLAHKHLFDIDLKIKTGTSPFPLEELIDNFFLNLAKPPRKMLE